MRMMMQFSIPVEAGNRAACAGSFGPTFQTVLEALKPEAAYFVAEGGKRTCYLFVNIQDASEIPSIAEPFFLALNAEVAITPAMNAQDLANAGPSIEKAAKKYGAAAQSAAAR